MKDFLKLENQLCFPIYALSRQFTNLYRPALNHLNITYPQYLVLMVLWQEEKISVKNLGEKLYLDSGTLTPLLKRMQENNILNRQRCTKDERILYVSLTQKGIDMQKQCEDIPNQLRKQLETNDEQLKTLQKLAKQVMQSINTNCKL